MPYTKELESLISLLQRIIIRLDMLLAISIAVILVVIAVMLFKKVTTKK